MASMKDGWVLVWKSTRKARFFAERFLAGCDDGITAGDVHGHGLGQVDVGAGVDRGRGLRRMEIGRRLDDDGVDARSRAGACSRKGR